MLFRDEVVRAGANDLKGNVLLGQPRATTVMVVLLGVLVAGFAVFAMLGDYARTENVRGILLTDPPPARIGIARQGVVSELFVAEGQRVEKGAKLFRIDTDVWTSEGARVGAESVARLSEEAELQSQQARDIRNTYRNARLQIENQISDQRAQLGTLKGQISLQEQVLASVTDIYERAASVADRGFVSVLDLERRRQQMLQTQQQLSNLEQQTVSIESAIRQAELERNGLANSMSRELSTIETNTSRLQRERSQMAGSRDFVIRAPIEGLVSAMQLSQGQSAQPGISAMTLVPIDKKIEAQLFAPTRAIGLVQVGQEVNLLVDAFPYQKFGNIKARVASVAATIVDPKQIDAPFAVEEPIFKVRVELSEAPQALLDRGVVLQPGMTLQGSIVLERQSFLDWMLSPLTAVTKRNQ